MMRIAHVANFYGPTSGGLRTAMHALGKGYLSHGHDVLLVVPGAADADDVTEFGRRVTVRSPKVPFSGGYRMILRTRRVRQILARFAPDVLEVSDRTSLRGLGRWAMRRSVPSVFFAHERADGILEANLPRWLTAVLPIAWLADRHNRSIRKGFTAVVCTTDYAAVEFARAGLDTVKVPLGVDLERFSPAHRSVKARAEYAAPDEVLILMGSRLSHEKRPDLAIDAVRALHDAGDKVRLVSAGTGAIDAAMRRRAVGAPVTFLGFVSDRDLFARLLASADVVVAPGPIETFGLAALEALASGTPAVVNANSALPEVVGTAGVAAAGTPADFAAAIKQVLARPERERRSAARKRAEEFPWSTTVETMIDLHRHHIAGGGLPRVRAGSRRALSTGRAPSSRRVSSSGTDRP